MSHTTNPSNPMKPQGTARTSENISSDYHEMIIKLDPVSASLYKSVWEKGVAKEMLNSFGIGAKFENCELVSAAKHRLMDEEEGSVLLTINLWGNQSAMNTLIWTCNELLEKKGIKIQSIEHCPDADPRSTGSTPASSRKAEERGPGMVSGSGFPLQQPSGQPSGIGPDPLAAMGMLVARIGSTPAQPTAAAPGPVEDDEEDPA
ncbi:uncharacterized protein LOC129600491 [Paramacrobiotus metropolitanus]|uniref:uncharacterized protein LOC129600491 n=1 Tax=Paramacrobiotus metropolitanus TaxID=2943436 RepID=UPI00244584DF|nr:uncharacterized protein LOC129600491 [Paramacrobiotus metropolitanus]XP_055355008.1 uncharacterized protein LOC129600491 [Paramacrobiotus metropolitanus]XP_055355009.1 uncharacterized protein LOC129600491 [Paramacrobiotus metropolitanus]XP_055355010.1 uncharacterized protein LOC129600491 [Paramacrobiotus metropolitanus]